MVHTSVDDGITGWVCHCDRAANAEGEHERNFITSKTCQAEPASLGADGRLAARAHRSRSAAALQKTIAANPWRSFGRPKSPTSPLRAGGKGKPWARPPRSRSPNRKRPFNLELFVARFRRCGKSNSVGESSPVDRSSPERERAVCCKSDVSDGGDSAATLSRSVPRWSCIYKCVTK